MSITVQNCGWKFAFQCPRSWEGLQPTDDPYVRRCDVCLEHVYRCDSDAEVRSHAKQGHCVALLIPDASTGLDELIGAVGEA